MKHTCTPACFQLTLLWSTLPRWTHQPQDATSSHHGRSLLQQDALSNSNGCLDTIPKCEAGACATRNVKGVARWVCLRCLSNYEAVVDDSGQDNIIQCGEALCLHQHLDAMLASTL